MIMNNKFKKLVDGLDRPALVESYLNMKREYMNLRIKKASPMEGFNPSVIRECRKNIARLKTRLRQLAFKKEGK